MEEISSFIGEEVTVIYDADTFGFSVFGILSYDADTELFAIETNDFYASVSFYEDAGTITKDGQNVLIILS